MTAGLLRGDRARFQLFGDTVNTASRMESTGMKGKIQISQSTADYLERAGKEHWFEPRDDLISAKGKGKYQCAYLYMISRSNTNYFRLFLGVKVFFKHIG